MHESSLLKDLLAKITTIAERNDADTVTRVRVRLGVLAQVSADHFREHFTHATVGTMAEGARLEIEMLNDPADPQARDLILDSIEIAER